MDTRHLTVSVQIIDKESRVFIRGDRFYIEVPSSMSGEYLCDVIRVSLGDLIPN